MGECLIVRSGGGTDTTNATAKSDTIVGGYTCYVNDELVIGSIPVIALSKTTVAPSEQISLLYGSYKNTNISTSTLEEETVSTVVSSDILKPYDGWSNGVHLEGDIVNNGTVTQSFGVNASYTIPQGWHDGSGKVTQALAVQGYVGITAGTGNQTVCDAGRWTTGEQWVWGDGNLVPWNIKNGVEIFGVWGNFTGWVDANLSLLGILTNRYDVLWVYDGYNQHHMYWWVWTASLLQYSSLRSAYTGVRLTATAVLGPDKSSYNNSPHVTMRAEHWYKSGNMTTAWSVGNASKSNSSYNTATLTASGSENFNKSVTLTETSYTIGGYNTSWSVPSHCFRIIVNVSANGGGLSNCAVTAYR
jgi:hypothetical protein